MDTVATSWLPIATIEALAATPLGMWLAPLAIFAMAFTVMGLSIPGGLTPTAFLSGLLMGFGGVLVVALAAALGSHALFLASRRWLGERMRNRFGERMETVIAHMRKRGPIYVASARFAGVPHALVATGAATSRMSARSFAGANLLGMLPAIVVATSAGSGLAML